MRADEHAAIGQRMQLGAARHMDAHHQPIATLKPLPFGAHQGAALRQRAAQQALSIFGLQVARDVALRVGAQQHGAAVAVGKRDKRLRQPVGRQFAHHFQLQADAAAEQAR